jgi:hypothetical protein
MTVTSQTCSCSKLHKGRTFYFKQRINDAMAECFPLSKDAAFEYKAEFDDETEVLTIYKDVRS